MWQISRPPCEWCEFGQVFNGQLGHLYKLGDWKTADVVENNWGFVVHRVEVVQHIEHSLLASLIGG